MNAAAILTLLQPREYYEAKPHKATDDLERVRGALEALSTPSANDARRCSESCRHGIGACSLSTPPADDVREALAEVLYEADIDNNPESQLPDSWEATCVEEPGWADGFRHAADRVRLEFEVRPRGTVTDAERLEYTVAAISDNGAITSLSGESTVVRDHLRGDLELYRQQQVEAGCDPERIIIAQRPIPKWARS